MDSLNIFALTNIPDAHCLVTAARSKYRLMSWMPDGCVAGEVVHELSCLSHCSGVPNFDLLISRASQNRALVEMTPLDTVHFSGVSGDHLDWS